jgi:hypothetical protein
MRSLTAPLSVYDQVECRYKSSGLGRDRNAETIGVYGEGEREREGEREGERESLWGFDPSVPGALSPHWQSMAIILAIMAIIHHGNHATTCNLGNHGHH